jgi:hypothetical protein
VGRRPGIRSSFGASSPITPGREMRAATPSRRMRAPAAGGRTAFRSSTPTPRATFSSPRVTPRVTPRATARATARVTPSRPSFRGSGSAPRRSFSAGRRAASTSRGGSRSSGSSRGGFQRGR